MKSGKISPIIRQFFSGAVGPKNPDSHAQQQQQQQQKEPDREPTHEEALEALDILSQEEEFQKSELRAELKMVSGRYTIVVKDRSGIQLKVIRGLEIVRMLDKSSVAWKGLYLGRILDRRV